MKDDDITIFDPRGKEENYKEEYPELTDYEEFSKITNKKLVWVWYVSNKTSPIFSLEFPKRCKKAAELVWGEKEKWNATDKIKEISAFARGEVTGDVGMAMERMGQFNFGARKEALMILLKEFNSLNELSKLKPSSFEIHSKEGSYINYKDFIEVKKKIRQELVELLPIIERGFGIKSKGKLKDELELSGQDMMDDFHKGEQGE